MKDLIIFSITIANIKALSHWFDVETDFAILSSTLIGPNQEYVNLGKGINWKTYSIDWETQTATVVKTINLRSVPNLGSGRIVGTLGGSVVMGAKTIVRYDAYPGKPLDLEEYEVLKSVGAYEYPKIVENTAYALFGSVPNTIIKFYRINVDQANDLQNYPVEGKTRAYSYLYGTPWVVASIFTRSYRTLFDYTNGYEGGSNTATQTHTKSGENKELRMMSPRDNRGVYVTSTISTRIVSTVNALDGSDRLNHDFTGIFVDQSKRVTAIMWVYDTDLCLTSTNNNKLLLFDFMDITKTRPITIVNLEPNSVTTQQTEMWFDKRAILVPISVDVPKTVVFKISKDDLPCSDLCATCDEVYRKKCLTCQPNSSPGTGNTCSCNSNYYQTPLSFTKIQCLQCSDLCQECSGGAVTDCTSCKDPNREVKGDGSCGCKDGYFLRSSSCISCAVEKSISCPQETKIEVDSRIEELDQNFLIKFSPSFKEQLSASDLPKLTTDSLLKQNLNLNFKEKSGKEAQLTPLNSSLFHTTTATESSSTLRVTFLQKLRTSKTESVKIKVADPWLYRPELSTSGQRVVYVKKDWEKRIPIVQKIKSDEEKRIERAKTVGLFISVGVFLVGIFTIVGRVLTKGASTSVILIIKFFNIIDKVSNLEKINVRFGSSIKIAFAFIESMSLPDLPLLGSLSPILDSEPDDPDASAYQLIPRGSKAKMNQENEQVLLASGQNFTLNLLIIFFWFSMTLLEFCLDNKSKVLWVVTFIYQIMIGLMFFDFQMISLAEVAFFDYNKMRSFSWKFIFSLILSMFVLGLIIVEFLKAIILLDKLEVGRVNESIDKVDKKGGMLAPKPE